MASDRAAAAADGGPTSAVIPGRVQAVVWSLLLVWPLALWVGARHLGPWGDEVHFLQTVRLFGAGITPELVRTYPEMSAPLTYVAYALWGHVAGFGTPALRLLSPLVAWATASAWLLVLRSRWGLTPVVVGGLALFVLNPYVVGLSVFVFTDMLALLGLALVTLGVTRDRPSLVGIGTAIATLSRQYLVFLAPAVILADLLCAFGPARRPGGRTSLATLVGLVPLGGLIVWWGWQLAPASPLRGIYVADGLRFDVHALSLYLAVPGAYLLPLLLPGARSIALRRWCMAAVIASLVLLAPVQPSPAQVREGVATVGFVHRALSAFAAGPVVDVIWWALATLWLASLLEAAVGTLRDWRAGRSTAGALFAWTACLAFLGVMPFSYMPWEKYALPLVMTGSLILLEWQARRVVVA